MSNKTKNPYQIISRKDLAKILNVSEKTARVRYKEFVELLEKPINKPYHQYILNKDLIDLGFDMI